MVRVKNLEGAQSQDVAIDRGETLEGEILELIPDRGVDPGEILHHPGDQFGGKFTDEGLRVAEHPKGL